MRMATGVPSGSSLAFPIFDALPSFDMRIALVRSSSDGGTAKTELFVPIEGRKSTYSFMDSVACATETDSGIESATGNLLADFVATPPPESLSGAIITFAPHELSMPPPGPVEQKARSSIASSKSAEASSTASSISGSALGCEASPFGEAIGALPVFTSGRLGGPPGAGGGGPSPPPPPPPGIPGGGASGLGFTASSKGCIFMATKWWSPSGPSDFIPSALRQSLIEKMPKPIIVL